MSVTVTVKLQLAESPDRSVTVQVSVIVPSGNAVPEGGTQTTLGEQSSETVGENVVTAVHAPGSCGLVMFPGHVICGGMKPPSGPLGQSGRAQPDKPTTATGLSGLVPNAEQAAGLKARLIEGVPLGRLGTPQEMANVAWFLASEQSSFVNGAEFFADGGAAQY